MSDGGRSSPAAGGGATAAGGRGGSASGPAAAAVASVVYIKLVDDPSFAEMLLAGEDESVAAFAGRACRSFACWRSDAAALELFLVAEGGDDDPTPEACAAAIAGGSRLQARWTLKRARVAAGAWLVARVSGRGGGADGASGGASCSGGAASAPHPDDIAARLETLERLAGRIRLGLELTDSAASAEVHRALGPNVFLASRHAGHAAGGRDPAPPT
jgi:hypothetical protein